MTELNKTSFLLFVILMIFPAHAFDVIFSSANKNFKQKSEITPHIENGGKTYIGTSNPLDYLPEPDTSKVIVYIIDKIRFVEIMRNAVRETRLRIAQALREWHYELVFLGIDNFDDDEYHLISAFMLEKIQPRNENQPNFTIETIGEDHFDRVYGCYVMNFEMYRENAQICGGTLRSRLRSIPRGALRPVGSYGKEVRLRGYHPTVKEVTWPVSVVDNTYFPRVNVSSPAYNFRIRYKKKKICLLILGGKEYSAVTSHKRLTPKANLWRILEQMTKKDEGLYILGAFNFDWTEIYIVTQIILQHSIGLEDYGFNVFTCGYGMFNSYYLNEYVDDGRNILPQPNSIVSEVIKALMGEKVKERAIIMYYSDDDGWKFSQIPIRLGNGRYFLTEGFQNYTFPWVNQRIAFIVYDSTEKNSQIDQSMVIHSVEKLKPSGIHVVLIETINFGLDDIHIIAEWIDYHRGLYMQNSYRFIDAEQIAVLGGGIFDTVFQSKSTTYNTLFDIRKHELKNIRNAFVKKGYGKRVFAARIDFQEYSDPKFEVWTYPMNTVNGVYEPDLIPDKNMFDTTGGKKIFFIVTSANLFHQIAAISVENTNPIAWLRDKIEYPYPSSEWTVFLVGLDNFGERDSHLFAELVKMQTRDERSLYEFVLTFNYGIGTPMYQYKDTPPFTIELRTRPKSHITDFFQMTCN